MGIRDNLFGFTHKTANDSHALLGIDASVGNTSQEKVASLRETELAHLSQKDQLSNPDSIITLTAASGIPLLGKFANTYVHPNQLEQVSCPTLQTHDLRNC
jgi:hypothetical protein